MFIMLPGMWLYDNLKRHFATVEKHSFLFVFLPFNRAWGDLGFGFSVCESAAMFWHRN